MRTLPDGVVPDRASSVHGPAAFRQRTAGLAIFQSETQRVSLCCLLLRPPERRLDEGALVLEGIPAPCITDDDVVKELYTY